MGKNKLIGKVILSGEIKVISGLRIGAGKDDVELGSPELPIVKTKDKQPFIPGSSLKGKMRSLLAKCTGAMYPEQDIGIVKDLFGESGNNDADELNINSTKLIFRDSYPSQKIITESKYENTIIRSTGAAKNPRQLERVPKDSIFIFEIVYNVYDEANIKNHLEVLNLAKELLNDDYLGGSGSRGYGKVEMTFTNFIYKKIEVSEGNISISISPALKPAISTYFG